MESWGVGKNKELDAVPTREETDLSIKQINAGKRWKSPVHCMIRKRWEGTPIPQDWIDGILVSLFKGKGLSPSVTIIVTIIVAPGGC